MRQVVSSDTAGRVSAYAWIRLFAALVLSGIGGVGMWSVIVALPAVQAEFLARTRCVGPSGSTAALVSIPLVSGATRGVSPTR